MSAQTASIRAGVLKNWSTRLARRARYPRSSSSSPSACGQLGERLVERLAIDVEVHEARLDVDRQRRAIGDRAFDGVVVQDALGVVGVAEGRPGVAIGRRDRRAGEADEAGVWKRRPHVETQAALLGAVGLVDHDDDVRAIVEEAGVGESGRWW